MVEVSTAEIKRQLQKMDPYDFEKLVAKVWEFEGYNTNIRKSSGDRGIDVEATKNTPFPQKVLIQAKRWSGKQKIGSDEVRKYKTLYDQVPDADSVVIVTTGSVTSEAERLARDLNVKIVDGDSFAELVGQVSDELSLNLKKSPQKSTRNPFKNNVRYKTLGDKVIHFNKCPMCNIDNLWLGKKTDGTKVIKCGNCDSKWKKVEADGWGTSTVRWKGLSKEIQGKVGTTDEWKHHIRDIEFEED